MVEQGTLTRGGSGADLSTILQLISVSDLDAAKKKLTAMSANAKAERTRGSLAAANGIITSLTKKKEGTLPTWDSERAVRAAHQILKSEMLDDFDRGYAETLVKFGKMMKPAKTQE